MISRKPSQPRPDEQLSKLDDPLWKPKETAEYARMSVELLAQLRFRGTGPRYLKPTPRTVLYRKSDVDDWLAASVRTGTGQVA